MDLIKILKNHIGETFYSALHGKECKVMKIVEERNVCQIQILLDDTKRIVDTLNADGAYFAGGECVLFPSKDNRNWVEFSRHDVAVKTWEDLVDSQVFTYYELYRDEEYLISGEEFVSGEYKSANTAEHAAMALLKLIQIVEHYNNVITNDYEPCTIIKVDGDYQIVEKPNNAGSIITFKHRKLAEEFLKHYSNRKLLRCLYCEIPGEYTKYVDSSNE